MKKTKTITVEQSVINKSVLNSSEIDFVWYTLAMKLGEKLIDEGYTKTHSTNNKFTISIEVVERD